MKKALIVCPCVLCVLLICQLIYLSNYQTPADKLAPATEGLTPTYDRIATDKPALTNELTLDAFSHIEPGISNYDEVFEICNDYDYSMMLTPSAHGANLKITVSDDRYFFIQFDMDLIVISIEYSRSKL